MNVVVCMWPTTAGGRVNMHVDGAHGDGILEDLNKWKLGSGRQARFWSKEIVYTLKGEFDQGKLSVPQYKDKQKTKVNISLSSCRFPCVRGWNGAVRTEWRSLSFALRWVFSQTAGPTLSAVLEEACLLMSSCFKRILSLWWVQNLSQRNLREGNG